MLARIDLSRYPTNFHIKVDSLARRRSTGSEAYITTSLLVGELRKLRLAKYGHAWRAAVHTVLMCDFCLSSGVVFYKGAGAEVGEGDWEALSDEDVTGLVPYVNGVRIDTGFCFVESVEGLCVEGGEGPVQILCNPRLIPTEDSASLKYGWMIDLAIHEVAHLWCPDHNEEFAGLLDKIRRSLRRWLSEPECIRRIGDAVYGRFRSASSEHA